MSSTSTPSHIGRKIGRIRELRGIKQETLAQELGVSQQTVSNIERSETIEKGLLVQVAKILGVTPEVIENFDEDKVINFFNNFHDSSAGTFGNGGTLNHHCTFNPLDKLIEVYEENKKLYERLVQAEKEKVAYLEQLLKSRE